MYTESVGNRSMQIKRRNNDKDLQCITYTVSNRHDKHLYIDIKRFYGFIFVTFCFFNVLILI